MVNKYFKAFREDALKTENTDDLIQLVENHLNTKVIPNDKVYPAVKEAWDNQQLHIMPGNVKLDKGIGIENMTSAHNCHSYKNGYCDSCGKCYARSQENMYAGVLMYNTINEILYDTLPHAEFKAQFREFYEEHEDLDFHRWNSFGEFKSPQAFKDCNSVSKMLENEFLVKSYSYTHNKELPVKTLDKSHIVINFSYNVDNKHKKCIVVPGKNLRDYYNSPEYVICLGGCGNCPYCKDPDFNKIVVFPQHGNGKSAKREVEKYFTRAEIYLMELERDMANLEFKRKLVDFYF